MLLWSLFFSVFAEPSKTVPKLGDVEVGKSFPTFGGNQSSGEYFSWPKTIGRQDLMIISYFATDCGPCKKNLPTLEAFIQNNSNVNGAYIAIEKDSVKTNHFAESLKLKTPIIMDKFSVYAKKHGVIVEGEQPSIPKTFLIDKKGIVKAIIVHEGEDLADFLKGFLPK